MLPTWFKKIIFNIIIMRDIEEMANKQYKTLEPAYMHTKYVQQYNTSSEAAFG